MHTQRTAAPAADNRRRLTLLPTLAPPSIHRLEAEAIRDAGLALAALADTLPERSDIREQLLDAAEDYRLRAALRGATEPARPVLRLV